MQNVTPEPIFQVASSFMAAKHLFVANEVGLFEHLAGGPTTLDELAQRTNVPRRTLRILADAMVALGFVERQNGHYQNHPTTSVFLSGQTPADLRPFLRFWNRISYPAWTNLEEAVRTGQPAFGHLTEDQHQIFSEGVEAVTAGTAMALPATYDFSAHRRVLDLGGGTGSFLIPILSQHSQLEATLFEIPHIAPIARQRLAGTPVAARVNIVEGDFFKNEIPVGHDVIILANIAHLFSPDHNRKLLRRLCAQVPTGARLLAVDFWTDPTHTQPVFAALMAGEFLAVTGEGDAYSVEEMTGWLRETGWQVVEHKALTGPASLIVAEALA